MLVCRSWVTDWPLQSLPSRLALRKWLAIRMNTWQPWKHCGFRPSHFQNIPAALDSQALRKHQAQNCWWFNKIHFRLKICLVLQWSNQWSLTETLWEPESLRKSGRTRRKRNYTCRLLYVSVFRMDALSQDVSFSYAVCWGHFAIEKAMCSFALCAQNSCEGSSSKVYLNRFFSNLFFSNVAAARILQTHVGMSMPSNYHIPSSHPFYW